MIMTYLLDSSTLPDPLDDACGAADALLGLPKERIEKIMRQKFPQGRKQSFAAGLLLRYALGQEPLSYNAFGRPSCAQAPFNLSHTENSVILSIYRPRELPASDGPQAHSAASKPQKLPAPDPPRNAVYIGCDIERRRKYQPRTARRFFTQAEYESLEAAESHKQAQLFVRYWTRKESVLKMTGIGMALPMELFDVTDGRRPVPDKEKIKAWAASMEHKEQAREYRKAAQILLHRELFFQEYVSDGCCITVCSTHGRFGELRKLKNNGKKLALSLSL